MSSSFQLPAASISWERVIIDGALMNVHSIFKGTAAKAVLAQIVVAALLIAWFKVGLPRIESARAASEAANRETRINAMIKWVVAEVPSGKAEAPGAQGTIQAYPQRLRVTPTVEEVEQTLGAPNAFYVDFRQGRHLIWTGTDHKLEASFDHDRLYCLRVEDLRTGHGALVFESSATWHPF